MLVEPLSESLGIAFGQDRLALLQRNVEFAEPRERDCVSELVDGVVAVSGVSVDLGGLQQPDPVVVPKALHREPAQPREAADRQEGLGALHVPRVDPPVVEESS